jgi:ParB family chromosome partitioning protein
MARRNALGRGLGALIPDSPSPPRGAEPAPEAEAPDAASMEIEVAHIDPNPDQPRRVFDPEEIERLASSIQRHGVLQPVVVRRAGDRYELVVGERRWRATQAAGRETIPAVVADVADADRLELALVENVQRQDLNAIELALAFRAMADAGATQEEVGSRVGLDRSSVANHLRLLDLSRDLQQDVEGGKLSVGHAKALLQVSNPERRRHLRDQIVERDLSVRQAEALARDAGGPARRKKQPVGSERLDPNLQRVVDLLRNRLKTRVRVQGDEKRGRIEIEYFGSEDLNRIVHAMLDAQ